MAAWLLLAAAPTAPDAVAAQSRATGHFQVERVAHAGGGLDGKTYTNSYEALDANAALGFQYFEIDFVFTSDAELVCLHDWQDNFERTFGFRTPAPLSLEEFLQLAADNDAFTNCTLDGLAAWLERHPGSRIVTDIRGDLEAALRLVASSIENHGQRIIPQVYQPAEAAIVRNLGYQAMIWTLYRFQGTPMQAFNAATRWGFPVAVAMPSPWVETGLPMLLRNAGIPSYVHTINSWAELHRLQARGVSEIYTAFLAPGAEPQEPAESRAEQGKRP